MTRLVKYITEGKSYNLEEVFSKIRKGCGPILRELRGTGLNIPLLHRGTNVGGMDLDKEVLLRKK